MKTHKAKNTKGKKIRAKTMRKAVSPLAAFMKGAPKTAGKAFASAAKRLRRAKIRNPFAGLIEATKKAKIKIQSWGQ
ncbi:MAG: hypothetical protein V1676_05955 [Candidatus Diapherotrites archaeon]